MLVGAAHGLFQRLATLVRPRRTRSGLGAFALPPEIILMVAAYLTNPSVISLALTCRTLHSLCFPRSPCLNTAEKEQLLLLMEKDIASLYFCHYCTKLHRWHTCSCRYTSTCIMEDLPCKPHLLHNFSDFPLTCYIPYPHARLVMNRHFYGPTHGLALHKLENRVWRNCPVSRVTNSETLYARIVDDKLLVLSVKTMHHSRGDSKALRSYVDFWGHRTCNHMELAKGLPGGPLVQLPELNIDKTTSGHFTPCEQSFGSCAICPTDYCIDISWRGKRKGYFIRVSVYRQLGECRSPFDWNWHTMTTLATVEEPRKAYPLEYRPGIVRDRWNKADGIDSRTEGQWVERARRASLRWVNTSDLTSIGHESHEAL